MFHSKTPIFFPISLPTSLAGLLLPRATSQILHILWTLLRIKTDARCCAKIISLYNLFLFRFVISCFYFVSVFKIFLIYISFQFSTFSSFLFRFVIYFQFLIPFRLKKSLFYLSFQNLPRFYFYFLPVY